MRAALIICDHAAVADTKLYISGGGWDVHRRPGQVQMGLGIRFIADWNEANRPIKFVLRLVTEDGEPVAQGDKPVEISGTLEFGRPPGIPAGGQLSSNVAVNLGLAIAAGAFRWELDAEGERLATESFRIVQPKAGQ